MLDKIYIMLDLRKITFKNIFKGLVCRVKGKVSRDGG
jgi:hypothetical protein